MALVTVEKPDPQVSIIAINRPERLNALSFDTVLPLRQAFQQAHDDNACRVVILTGNGRGFCSGLDLEEAGVPPNIEGLTLSRIAIRSMEIFAELVLAMRDLHQPVIAAINGPAYGGGLCLAAGADIRVAGESARFCMAGIRNGLTATELGISYTLPRLIGASRAHEIMLSGREVDAVEAERIGLVSRVVPDHALMDTALELAHQMCGYSPHGLAMTKRVLRANLEAPSLAAAMDLENRNQLLVRLTTENLQEAIAARKEGRKPHYRD